MSELTELARRLTEATDDPRGVARFIEHALIEGFFGDAHPSSVPILQDAVEVLLAVAEFTERADQ